MKTKQKIRSTLTLPELIIRGLKSDKETFVSTFSLSQCHLCVCVCCDCGESTQRPCACVDIHRGTSVYLIVP